MRAAFTVTVPAPDGNGRVRVRVRVLPTQADVESARLRAEGRAKRFVGEGQADAWFQQTTSRQAATLGLIVLPADDANLPELTAHEATHATLAWFRRRAGDSSAKVAGDEEQMATLVGALTGAICGELIGRGIAL